MSEQMKMDPEAHASADTIIRDSGAVSANHLNEIEFLNTTALLSDPSQFAQAREEEREAEQLYRQASDAFLRHREEQGAELPTGCCRDR